MFNTDNTLPIFVFKLIREYPVPAMIADVMRSHQIADYSTGNNFPIIDSTGAFDILYSDFFDLANNNFGPLDLSSQNIRTCWGYVNNKYFYKGGIHNHLRTSTINAVYYLDVPTAATDREGSLSFYNDAHGEIYNIRPSAGDLIVFPNYLNHQPHQSFTHQHRISVNMEIICKDVWKNWT